MDHHLLLEIAKTEKVIPVIVIDDPGRAMMLMESILEGGLSLIEVTLRTVQALSVLEQMRIAFPEAVIGAGTVISRQQYFDAMNAGAQFVGSPGVSAELIAIANANDCRTPYFPGAASASEVQLIQSAGLPLAKLFPINALGGKALVESLAGPYGKMQFCPTGGLSQNSAKEFLQLDNVACVGGSWMAPQEWIEKKNWNRIIDAVRACKQLRYFQPQ